MAPAAVSGLELSDVQGLVARGYGNLPAARFLLLRLEDGEAARSWLGAILETVTHGDEHPEARAVNVAFTGEGLGRLGLSPEVLAQFSNELVTGMTTEHRRRVLGDLGPDAPEHWDWGGPQTPTVGAVLLLYARDDLELARLVGEQSSALGDAGIRIIRQLETSDLDGFEPFGFRDGISQPIVEGLSKRGPPGQTVKDGEFVLGYENEHGRFTDEPLLEAAGGIGRNGTYLVLRQLRQDVTSFWRFLDSVTPDAEARDRLAAKMVGRWPGGASLTLSPESDDPALAEENDFGYHEADADGARCPIGSHVRRTNPRDSLDPRPGTDRSWAINKRHRLLRRGPRVRPVTDADRGADRVPSRGGARARPALHLPERQHRTPVRVRPAHVGEQPEVRGPVRRRRPADGPVEAVRRNVHCRGYGAQEPLDRSPPLHLGQGRRLLLPPRPPSPADPLSEGSDPALIVRRECDETRTPARGSPQTPRFSEANS